MSGPRGGAEATAPITQHFKYHAVCVPDAKTGAIKTFRLACATTLPSMYGADKQDYTPEMLRWDTMLVNSNANTPPMMAQPCEFDIGAYEAALEEASTGVAFVEGHIKTFKHHAHFVADAKVGEKKFFVACMTALPRMYGAEDQHYTPEMLRWDEMQLDATPPIAVSATMAALCQIDIREVLEAAVEALEQSPDAMFKHHVHEVTDPKTGVLKKFFVASMASPPEMYGAPQQHYSPEMMHWDFLRRDNVDLQDGLAAMATLCGLEFGTFK